MLLPMEAVAAAGREVQEHVDYNFCRTHGSIKTTGNGGGYHKRIGNWSFEDKKAILGASGGFVLTREVASYAKWTPKEIEQRQQRLATLTVQTWPFGKASAILARFQE
jgi:hypothetical protein